MLSFGECRAKCTFIFTDTLTTYVTFHEIPKPDRNALLVYIHFHLQTMKMLLLYTSWFCATVVVVILLRLLYQAIFNPLHIVLDLDHTVLCSITPLDDGIARTGRRTDYFDQIDDDFPFVSGTPNTRTFWRPGARAFVRLCRAFGQKLYIFTAAQGTYTHNILDHWESRLFVNIIHRDLVPHFDHDRQSAPGKDLTRLFETTSTTNNTKDSQDNTTNLPDSSSLSWPALRTILLDDRVTNFIPQPRNGLHVHPYKIHKHTASTSHCTTIILPDWEILRWARILTLCLAASDARAVLQYFQSPDHRDYLFPQQGSVQS